MLFISSESPFPGKSDSVFDFISRKGRNDPCSWNLRIMSYIIIELEKQDFGVLFTVKG